MYSDDNFFQRVSYSLPVVIIVPSASEHKDMVEQRNNDPWNFNQEMEGALRLVEDKKIIRKRYGEKEGVIEDT